MLLVVNAGSSSLKMLWLEEERKVFTAKWEKSFSQVTFKGTCEEVLIIPEGNASKAFEFIVEYAEERMENMGYEAPSKVGYRVVHGGEIFTSTTEVDSQVLAKLAEIDYLAPNHNPVTREVIASGLKMLPNARHFMCFDTMFHQTMPMTAKMYGIDLKYYNLGVRKFGFHGLSHEYVAKQAAKILGKSFDSFSGITCHLGNGSSITAIENGKSIDTTMGLTPVDGLVMGERCGSIDPSVVKSVGQIEGLDVDETIELLSKGSGFKAISGISSDYRILKKCAAEDPRAEIALNLFKYQVRKYIGAFMTALSHVDMVVFTGGIGENDPELVRDVIETPGMKNLGLSFNGGNIAGKIPVVQISTDEEMHIASLIKEK